MAWVSPKVYAILSSSEEGKDIIEKLPDMTQEECSQELDAFFGEGGKGASSGNDYAQAKIDDEAEENAYRAQGDIEASEADLEDKEDFDNVKGEHLYAQDDKTEYMFRYLENNGFGDVSPALDMVLTDLDDEEMKERWEGYTAEDLAGEVISLGEVDGTPELKEKMTEYFERIGIPSQEKNEKGLVKETLLDKFDDAHLYNDDGKFQLALSNGKTEEFNTYNEAIDRLSEYSKKDYSWAKREESAEGQKKDFEVLTKERDLLWNKMPDVTKKELQRLIEIRNLLGDDKFYEGK